VDKNGDRVGSFRGVSGTLRREGRRKCCGYSEVSMWQPPPVSVIDQGVGTREQVLNVPIAYRWYGPDKPSSMLSTDVWLLLLLPWLYWKRNWVVDLRTTQPGWRLCREPFFLGAVGSVQRCWWLVKGCHIRRPPTGSVCQTYVDWRGKHTCPIGWVFPYRVYIDSNRRDSQTWVTACSWLSSSSNLQD
jgi:hypothetical protein